MSASFRNQLVARGDHDALHALFGRRHGEATTILSGRCFHANVVRSGAPTGLPRRPLPGRRYLVFGGGVGADTLPEPTGLAAGPATHRCDFVGVNGPLAAEWMQRGGGAAEVIGPLICQYVEDPPETPRRATIGVQVGRSNETRRDIRRAMARAIDHAVAWGMAEGLGVELIAIDPADFACAQAFSRTHGLQDRPLRCHYGDPHQVAGMLKHLSLVIAMDPYTALLALGSGAPTICTADDIEARDVLASAGALPFLFCQDRLTSMTALAEVVREQLGPSAPEPEAVRRQILALRHLQRDRAAELNDQHGHRPVTGPQSRRVPSAAGRRDVLLPR